MVEVWKDIPGYEGLYQASTFGNIRSLDRVVKKANSWGTTTTEIRKGRMLKFINTNGGYVRVTLVDRQGLRKIIRIHSLVALTFIGDRPKNNVVRHLNGNPKNNNLYNLAYGTKRENVIDMYRCGEKNGVLSINQVMEIRLLIERNENLDTISNKYGISVSQTRAIKNNKCFQWLSKDGVINE